MFSGFFAIPLDTMAISGSPVAGFGGAMQNYLSFLPDRNNLDFFKTYPPYPGTGYYGGTYAEGLTTVIGLGRESSKACQLHRITKTKLAASRR